MTELAIFGSVAAAYVAFLTWTASPFMAACRSVEVLPARVRISRVSFLRTNS